MGRRGRLGGLAGRRDRASDRRREMADLTYDGSAPSACALLQQASALRSLPFSNALDPSTQLQADGRMRKERAVAAVSVAVRGSKRPRIGRVRGLDGVLSECARGLAPPLSERGETLGGHQGSQLTA